MRIFILLILLIILPKNIYSALKTPHEQPQMSIQRSYSIARYYPYAEMSNIETYVILSGGGGWGYEIEIPYKKKFNLGFSLNMSSNTTLSEFLHFNPESHNSPEEKLKKKTAYYYTQLLFFAKLQSPMTYPKSLNSLTSSSFVRSFNPYIKISAGAGGGSLMGLLYATASIPVTFDVGLEVYFNNWLGLAIQYQEKADFHYAKSFVDANIETRSNILYESSFFIAFKTTFL